jgi:hypothetical protein
MIETEEQRRWWFATHPEYSSSRRGIRENSDRGENEHKVDPKEVDAYVDEALKYETGSVADLLRSVKRNFGTEGNREKEDQSAIQERDAGTGGTRDQMAESPPEDDPSYWEGYYAAQKLIWNREQLPPYDPNDNSPYAQGFGKGVLAAYRQAEAAGKLWQAFQDTWDTLTSWLPFIGSSRTLGNKLEKAGDPKLADHATHHIVAEHDSRAERARQILDNFGIKTDDIENGVRLPYKKGIGTGEHHPAVHTDRYYQEVENLLKRATSKEEAIRTLKDIGQRLKNGTFHK